MCRWIFKKELNEAYTELNNSYCREVRRVEAAMEHNEKKYGLMKRIFSLLPTAEIIGLEENGNKEELIVVLHDNSIYSLEKGIKVFVDCLESILKLVHKKLMV